MDPQDPPALRIERLTSARLEEWLSFFDGDAFADNPSWGGCYCRAFLFEHGDDGWDAWDAACESGENRGAMEASIQRGDVDGLLAYVGDRVVGWCHLGPRERFPVLGRGRGEEVDSDAVAAVVCFVVAAGVRRQGIARALLAAACAQAREDGYASLEGYPARCDDGAPDREYFRGPVALYRDAGFDVLREGEHGWVVRRLLDA